MLDDLVRQFVRKVDKSDIYLKRLRRELKLIKDRNFVQTFLQVKQILDLTRDIPHVIRGSAGSSYVCYLLGITDIDPIYYNISLARFMHEHRTDNPDIDIDFPHNRREEVYQRIYDHFGKKNVARISNRVYYKEKSALREAVRMHGYNKQFSKYTSITTIFDQDEVEEVYQTAANLINTFRGFSLHCGGIVIFDGGIPDELILKGNQIKLDKDQVEQAGYIKIDILSNRALSQLADLDDRSLLEYPEYDEETSELLSNGDNMGITMAESPAMRKIFTAMKPKSRMDVAFALALLRPAAAADGNKEKILEGHDPVLVFDDDAIIKFQEMLGCSEADADNYRRAFAKNKEEKIEEFLSRIAEEDRQIVRDNFRRLSLYSFCKSHAISYGQLVWALAYQKTRQPKEFWLSAINHCESMYEKWVFFRHAKAVGLDIVLGKGPWTIESDVLIPAVEFTTKGDDKDFEKYKYWTGDEFLGSCYCEEYEYDDENWVRFKGLVATYRRYSGTNKNGKAYKCTFITVGYEDGKMLDLVVYGQPQVGRFNYVEGYGVKQNWCSTSHVQVKKYKMYN